VNLKDATFNGNAYFESTHFIGAADFMNASFNEGTLFGNAIFDDKLILMNAIFAGPIFFTNASIKGKALFEHAKFNNYTNFHGSHFYEDAHFGWAKLNGLTWFNEVIFDKATAFDNCKIDGELECIQAVFNGQVKFLRAEFKDRSSFGDCVFRDTVNFDHAWFSGRANFKGKTFYAACSFQNLSIAAKMRLEGVDCKQISFLDTDVRQIDFVNCNWLKTGRRRILFDEQVLPSNKKERSPVALKKVESLYRKLKQKYKDEHDEAEVSVWHYNEKNMARQSLSRPRKFLGLTALYAYSSGYGERPVRAFIVLLLMLVGFSIALLICGLALPKGVETIYGITNCSLSNVLSVKSIGASFMNLLKYVTFQKDSYFIPTGWTGEVFKLLAQILVPVQAALLALAVRNRYRR
jgi:hypothetical protein